MMTPEAVQAIIAQVLAIQPNGMTQQQAIQISEVLTAAIPAAAATPRNNWRTTANGRCGCPMRTKSYATGKCSTTTAEKLSGR